MKRPDLDVPNRRGTKGEETDPEGVIDGSETPVNSLENIGSVSLDLLDRPSCENQDSLNSYDSEGGEDKRMGRFLIIYPLHFPGYPMAQGNQIKNENPKDNNEFDC